ncbi:hypothetical protein DOY81_000206 [Sarcophaga bullata]|nr:hypothetical protein DOY81_000206 [Sarcophaga bullata]
MNWNLNTALQLNPHQYLAVFNRQNRTPIDVIHHQNNLSMFTKYLNKYDVNNYTRSVNSVRTPLTQYQLYKIPSIDVLEEQTSNTFKQNDYANLYPGKRFLNLDLPLHNVTSFTDTIFNLPTPTDDIIPIIITEGTPTTCSKTINDIEDLNKLRPPVTTAISTLLTIAEKPNSKKPEIPKKPAMLSSILNEIHTKKSNTIKTTKAVLKLPSNTHAYADITSSHNEIQTLKLSPETLDSHLKETANDESFNTSTNTEEPTVSVFSILKETENPNPQTTTTIKSASVTSVTSITNSNPKTIPNETLENILKPTTISTTNTHSVINETTNTDEIRISPLNTITNSSGITSETVAKTSTINPNKDSILFGTTTLPLKTVLDSNSSKNITAVAILNSKNSTTTTTTNHCGIKMGNNVPAEKPSTPTSTTDSFSSKITTAYLEATSDLDSNTREPSIEILNTNPTTSIATLANDLIFNRTTSPSTITTVKAVERSSISNETTTKQILNLTTPFVATNLFQTTATSLTRSKNANERQEEVKNRVLQQKLIKNTNSKEESRSSSLASDTNESLESICQPSSDSEGSLAMDLK